ncbi:putative restriction endonuclease [Pectobacterium phage vB_PcaM_P7_Pc]|nr:putative restriction endonuclease [Pectobacterium phage vB_PcaM_P7_Pc]
MVYGKGIYDGGYNVRPKGQKMCPYYMKWMSMLQRCYDEGALSRDPSYRDVTVCDEWRTFSNFKAWMETKDWEGKCLDKDLKGGDEYSPDTCLFISEDLNRYWTMKRKGVSWEEDRQKWRVKIGRQHIGRYTTEQEAREAYELCKVHGLNAFLGKESPEVDAVLRSIIEN